MAEPYRLPHFRNADTMATPPSATARPGPVVLLADSDFAPYSFTTQGGGPAGLAVELALNACSEAGLSCEVRLMAFAELLPALQSGRGHAILSGPRLDEATLQAARMTRPYFRTMARFAVQSGNPLTSPSAEALSGKRIAAVKDTVHARWLEAYYGKAEIVTFDTAGKAGEALRTGNVDAAFGDNLQTIYWVSGAAAQGCCRLLGGAFSDFDFFSRNIAFLVREGHDDLRDALDAGLDAAQARGATERIFNAYVPLNPW